MIISLETARNVVSVGTGVTDAYMRIKGLLDALIQNSQSIFSPSSNFLLMKESILDDIKELIEVISGDMIPACIQFDTQYSQLFEAIASNSAYEDLDMEVVARMTDSWIDGDLTDDYSVFVPARLIHLLEDTAVNPTPEEVEACCVINPDETTRNAGWILTNTIATKKIMRENGAEEIYEGVLHSSRAIANALENIRPKLHELQEYYQAPELQDTRLRIDNDPNSEASLALQNKLANGGEVIKLLTAIAYAAERAATFVASMSITCRYIANTSILVDAAWNKYVEKNAITF